MTGVTHIDETVTIGGDLTVGRIGYGAMQLTGPKVWGDYPDHDKGVALLREVVAAGVTFIDTADAYGPHSNEELIREALHPYPEQLVIATKGGFVRSGPEYTYRTIAYDRRGFGQSSQPTTGYDYDTFTADLKALLDHLSLDRDVVLCGFSMGTGEVTHYLGTDGSAGVSKAVLFGAIPPFLLKTDDNPEGVDKSVFDDIKATVLADRYKWFDDFFANFYNTDELAPERIGNAALRASFQVAASASWYASYACVDTWLTDFRADVEKIDIPTLVVHGTKDRILPFENTAGRLEALNPNIRVVPVENGPHNIGWTFPEESNRALLDFLGS